MESAVINLCGENDKLLSLNSGKFGERWGEIASACKISSVEHQIEWGQSVDLGRLESTLLANRDVSVVCMQHCETSTTVLHPVREICALVRRILPNAITVVDAISSALSSQIDAQENSIDLLLTASQKAFMLPPGLVMLGLSNRAWAKCEQVKSGSLYFDLVNERKGQLKGVAAWTPATSLIMGLAEVLSIIEEITPEKLIERHLAYQKFFRKILATFKLTPLAVEYPANCVTGFKFKNTGLASLLRSKLLEQQILVAGGQDQWKDTVVRIGHMGLYSIEQLMHFASAFERSIHELGLSTGTHLNLNEIKNLLHNSSCFDFEIIDNL